MGYHWSAREGVIRSCQDTRKERQDTGETSGHRKHGRTHTKTQMGAVTTMSNSGSYLVTLVTSQLYSSTLVTLSRTKQVWYSEHGR